MRGVLLYLDRAGGQVKPTIPEVIERFSAYHEKPRNGAWGGLHVVLEDHNVHDDNVRFCLEMAEKEGDTETAELAALLLRMSKTQRLKIPRKCQCRDCVR